MKAYMFLGIRILGSQHHNTKYSNRTFTLLHNGYHSQTLKLLSSDVVTNLLPLSTNVMVFTAPRCLIKNVLYRHSIHTVHTHIYQIQQGCLNYLLHIGYANTLHVCIIYEVLIVSSLSQTHTHCTHTYRHTLHTHCTHTHTQTHTHCTHCTHCTHTLHTHTQRHP